MNGDNYTRGTGDNHPSHPSPFHFGDPAPNGGANGSCGAHAGVGALLVSYCGETRQSERSRLARAIRKALTTPVDRASFEDERAIAYAAEALAPDPKTADVAQWDVALRRLRERFPAPPDPADEGKPHDEGGDDWTSAPSERDWLVPGWLPAGRVCVFVGEGGAGKSRLSLQLCLSVAAGKSNWLPDGESEAGSGAFPLTESEPSVAVFATWEDEKDEVKRYIHRIEEQRPGWQRLPSLGNRFRYVAPAGPMWAPRDSSSGHTSTMGALTVYGQNLRRYCEARKARLLVLDPCAAAYASNENDRGLVRAFITSWDWWARCTQCAVIIIAHPPKHGGAYSGSTDWFAGARAFWSLGLAPTKDGEANGKKGPCAPRLSRLKSSYGPPTEAVWLSGFPSWGTAATAEEAAKAWAASMERSRNASRLLGWDRENSEIGTDDV